MTLSSTAPATNVARGPASTLPGTYIRLHPTLVNGKCPCGKGDDCAGPTKCPAERWRFKPTGELPRDIPGGLGLLTGHRSPSTEGKPLFVIDLDVKSDRNGHTSFAALAGQHGQSVAETREHAPPHGGGKHLLYYAPIDFRVSNSKSKLGPGIDVRGEGGFVVAPGSPHRLGGQYEVTRDVTPLDAPEWLLEELRAITKETTAPVENFVAGRGERHVFSAANCDPVKAAKLSKTFPNTSHTAMLAALNITLDAFDRPTAVSIVASLTGDSYEEVDRNAGDSLGRALKSVYGIPTLKSKWPQAVEWLEAMGLCGVCAPPDLIELFEAVRRHMAGAPAANDVEVLRDLDLEKAFPKTTRYEHLADDVPTGSKDLPVIPAGIEIHAVVEGAKKALARDSQIFQREGRLVQFNIIAGVPSIREIKPATLKSELSRVADWMITDKKGTPARGRPPVDVVAAVAEVVQWPAEMRSLTKIVETPTLRKDGSVLQEPGYDAATTFYYAPNAVFPAIPEAPTQEDARRAFAELYEPFSEFACSEAEKCVGVAAVLTSLAMGALGGENYPAFVFEANVQGAGKGLSCNVVSLITTGRLTPPQTFPSSDKAELEKILGGVARDGYPLVCFDNISAEFGGDALEGRMTCGGTSQSRILGKSETVRLPWRTIIMATGNNIAMTRDMCRRVLRCRIVRLEENPQEKNTWKIPDLEAWVRAERPRLVVAGLTLLRAFSLGGCPNGDLAWGSFNAWSQIVAGAIVWAGGPNVLDTRIKTSEAFDENMATLGTLFGAWPEELLGKSFSFAELDTDGIMPIPGEASRPALKGVFDDVCDGNDRGRKQRVGAWLRRRHEQVLNGRQLVVAKDKASNLNVYSVRHVG